MKARTPTTTNLTTMPHILVVQCRKMLLSLGRLNCCRLGGIGIRSLVLISTLLFAMAFFSPAPKAGLAAEPSEYDLKAAFVYNFIKFVEWPSSAFSRADAPITIGILGQDPMDEALESLKSKTAQGRKLTVRRFAKIGDLEKCHVLFVGKSERESLAVVLKQVRDSGVLTIADIRGFAAAGGIVNFINVENRISFEINTDAADRAGLRVSSQLLKLAKIVGR
jgi:hypothetical protein